MAMPSPALMQAFSQASGLDFYGVAEARSALISLFTITGYLPSSSCCAIGGMAVVIHVGAAHDGSALRQISPDLDLLVDPSQLSTLAKLIPVTNSLLGLSVIGSAITIDIIAALDPLQEAALVDARLHNVAGVFQRVISPPYLIALKLLAGRDKDMADINLLFLQSDKAGQRIPLQQSVRQILSTFCPELIEDFDSRCQAWQSGIGF
jgi:hypothetical protein